MRTRFFHSSALCGGVIWLAGIALLSVGTCLAQNSTDIPSLFAHKSNQPEVQEWWQHIRIGMPITVNVKARFNESGLFTLPGTQTGATGVNGVNHVYDDGYVKVDNTGDAAAPNGVHYTSFWGYQNAGQYDPGTGLLTMHSATSYTASGSASESTQPFVGIELGYGTDLWNRDPLRLGWEINAGLTPIRASDSQAMSSIVNQSVFTFDTGGIIMPTAPYNGGPSGIGPTINDMATSAGSSTVSNGVVTGSRKLDVLLYTLRLGPTVSWDLNEQWRLMAGAGGVVGLVDGHYKFDEDITTPGGGTSHNSGQISMTRAVYGGYVDATVFYRVMNHGDVFLGARFMPLSSASVNSMGREARLDLSGAAQFIAGVSWPF